MFPRIRSKITEFLMNMVPVSRAIFKTVMSDEDISKVFETNELVPQLLDQGPASELSIQYGGGGIDLKPGAEFTPEQTKNQPIVGSWSGDPNKFYALIMFDPDAISRSMPMFRSVLHWYAGNIPGNEINQATIMSPYKGPGPPMFTGLHRYVFVVYEQLNGKIEYPTSYFYMRVRFSVKDAIKKFNLSPQQLAGNFFQAKHS